MSDSKLSPSRAVSLNGIFGVCVGYVISCHTLFLCSVFWLIWWENERVPHLAWRLVVSGGQCCYSSQCIWLLVPSVWECPKAACPGSVLLSSCRTPHCTVLWYWRPGSVFPHQPCRDHPPHSSSCPGLQLGIFTPNGSSFLVSQGIQTGAGIASLCGHCMSPQRLRTPHLSFISLPLLGTLWTENVGASITVSLQLWTVIPRRIPGYLLFPVLWGIEEEDFWYTWPGGGRAAAQET